MIRAIQYVQYSMQCFNRSLSQMLTSVPFNHILSSVNDGSAAIVVFAHSCSVDNVPLIESFTGKINFSSRFPPESDQNSVNTEYYE